ncbi:hypothetical protein B0H14DRAFT_3497385 [Mycena olivaceomarginata]|nr:hypothetical protein B0H14DRAFT_3497385 [Mycena olivaceomarginata]
MNNTVNEVNLKVTEDGRITQVGDAELPDAAAAEEEEEEEEEEEQTSEPEVRGRGQRKKIAARRYLGLATWAPHVTVTTFNLFSSQASVTRHLNFRL